MNRITPRCQTLLALLCAAWWIGCSDSSSVAVDSQLTPVELQAEIMEAFAEPLVIERMEKLSSALSHLNSENIETARLLYEEHIEGLGELELRPFFDAWVRFDGVSALEYASSIPFTTQADIARTATITSWAMHDLIAARVAAEQLTQDNKRQAEFIYHALLQGWAAAGHPGLDDYVLKSPNAGPAIMAILPAVYQRVGGEQLMNWSNDIIYATDSYSTKVKAYRMTIRVVSFRNPRSAIPFVMQHYNTGEKYAKEGPRVLAENWLRTEPMAALNWLKTEAPEQVRAEALGLVFATWLNINQAEAKQWIDSLPSGDPYYQPVYNTMARRLAKRMPEKAVEWCKRAETEQVNPDCLRPVAVAWYKQDPVAAGLWLEEESGLPVEELNNIRRRAFPPKKN